MILINCCFIIISVGRNAVFHLEKVVGVAVNIGFRRGGEAHHHGVEILENRPILFEYAPMAFVNND